MLQEPPARPSAGDHSTCSGEETVLDTSLAGVDLGELRGELRRVLDGMDAGFVDDVVLTTRAPAVSAPPATSR